MSPCRRIRRVRVPSQFGLNLEFSVMNSAEQQDSSDWTFPLSRAAAYLKLDLELAASLDSSKSRRRAPIKIIEPPTNPKTEPLSSPTLSLTSSREAKLKEKPSSTTQTISKPNFVSTPTSPSTAAASTGATPHPPSTAPPLSSSSPASLSSSSPPVQKSPLVASAAASKLTAEVPKTAAEPEPSSSSTSPTTSFQQATRSRRKQEVVGDGNVGESSSPAAREDNVDYHWRSSVSLGTKISTLFEFTRGWDRLAQQGEEELARKAIGPSYPTMFQNSLEPPVLMRIFKTFRAALDENSPNSSLNSSASASVFPAAAQNQAYTNVTSLITIVLQALLQVCRIRTVTMFLRSGEREMMRGVVGEVFRALEQGFTQLQSLSSISYSFTL
ncbi:hypothetical protein GYMLUDRAFT_239360 [Collybiopsis luxurians FD-317 M1]|nr:hypothetical protein GYMLUDRAFT_239360 [Collybiopsis luxurians FD-317 M1]